MKEDSTPKASHKLKETPSTKPEVMTKGGAPKPLPKASLKTVIGATSGQEKRKTKVGA